MVAFYQQERAKFHTNDAVAVVRRLPWGTEMITVTKIRRIGTMLIETFDQHFFSVIDGKSLGGRQASYIELANLAHLAALQSRQAIR
jgi:hypothetical protein